MVKKIVSLVAVAVVMSAAGQTASAVPAVSAKDPVTICHRDSAVKKPYVQITVDADAADGDTQNDNGQGDHSEHMGPVATSETVAQALKDNKDDWGDIIPPHDNYAGLNWTAEGQAIYNNDCNYATPGMGSGNPTPSTPSGTVTPSTPQVAAPARGQGVNAGGGSTLPSLVALLGSVVAFGYGILRFRKLNI